MPFNAVSELPDNVREVLPEAAQSIFLGTANTVLEDGGDDSAALATAWTAVRRAGYRPGPGGNWVEKHELGYDHQHLKDQRAVDYAPASELETSCATCKSFVPEGYFGGTCELIAGPIRPDYICNLYERDEEVTEDTTTQTFVLSKVDESRGLAFGWANVPTDAEGGEVFDAHGESIAVEELEEAAYHFVLFFRDGGEMHKGESKASLIESVVFTPEKKEAMGLSDSDIPDGAWWLGMQVHDAELRKEVAQGNLRAFSIQGAATFEEVTDDD